MKNLTDLKKDEIFKEVILDPVSRMDLIKYSGASGDFNPIHTIDVEATSAGLPGIIAHGMWTMGNLAKLFTSLYDVGFMKDYTIRFRKMVFLDDVVTLRAIVSEVGGRYVDFDVTAVNQNEEAVLKGKVRYLKYN